MENFELLRNVTIGQYIPTGSVIHRLDPRAKLLAASFLILAISFASSILANIIFLIVILIITRISRIDVKYLLRGFILGLPILIFIFVMQFLFMGRAEPAGYVFFEWGWFRITQRSLYIMALSGLRLLSFVFLTSLITMTSTTTELTHGVEQLLRPFRRVRVPSHELALILMIALRFVPTLAEEMENIMKAQASRGADIGTGRMWRPDKAAKAYLPLIVPLFLNAFRRAEDLVWAMEARGYVGGEGRTNFIQLKSRGIDYVVVIAAFLFMIFMMVFPWPSISPILRQIGFMG
ncbi:MAG: energy-coupling factor transporter transmembrane protein EcfT [Chloroflexi bacterium]|nr:energy-coupling factor transporter transmembrane protein EcfT [Chloroflexota bacterium]